MEASSLSFGEEEESARENRSSSSGRSSERSDAETGGAERRSDVGEFDRRLRVVLREHPFAAVGIAIGAGYLLGRIMREL